MGLGLLGGFVLLARTDYAVILAPCALDLLWTYRRRWQRSLPVLAGGLVLLPWLWWNQVTFGSIRQVSGGAYPYYLHTIWENEGHVMAEWLRQEAQMAYGVLANLAQFSGFDKSMVLLFLSIAWVCIEAVRQRRRKPAVAGISFATLWPLFCVSTGAALLLALHGLVRWMYVPWYFAPASLLLTLWFTIVLAQTAQVRRSVAVVVAVVVAVMFVCWQVIQILALWKVGGMWPEQRLSLTTDLPHLEQLCSRYDTIGVSDAGYAGYVLPCRVVNLDGVVNNHAHDAIVNGRFRRYLDEAGIDAVVINHILRQVIEPREGTIPTLAPFSP
jgi:hypothetical protein